MNVAHINDLGFCKQTVCHYPACKQSFLWIWPLLWLFTSGILSNAHLSALILARNNHAAFRFTAKLSPDVEPLRVSCALKLCENEWWTAEVQLWLYQHYAWDTYEVRQSKESKTCWSRSSRRRRQAKGEARFLRDFPDKTEKCWFYLVYNITDQQDCEIFLKIWRDKEHFLFRLSTFISKKQPFIGCSLFENTVSDAHFAVGTLKIRRPAALSTLCSLARKSDQIFL